MTFRVEASGASSFIDHFAVTQQLYDSILSCDIIDNGSNLSDHCALSLSVRIDVECKTPMDKHDQRTGGRDVTGFRWDIKADLFAYYCMTGQLLNNIFAPYELLLTHGDCTDDVHVMAELTLSNNLLLMGCIVHQLALTTAEEQFLQILVGRKAITD